MALLLVDDVQTPAHAGLYVDIYEGMPPVAVTDAWRALAVAAENPFATPEWMEAWCEAEPAHSPLIAVSRDADGDVIGVVPLVVTATGALLAAGADYADWFGPACEPADEAAVAAACMSALARNGHLGTRGEVVGRPWTMQRCLSDGGWLEGIKAGEAPDGVRIVPTGDLIELSAIDFSAPLPISGKDRRELRRSLRRLGDAHDVNFRCARTSQDADRAFDDFKVLHTGRWSHLCDPSVARFHEGFALRAAARGWLRLWTLDVDGAPAAMLYGWRVGDRQFAYLQAFDPRWSRHGVGILLLAHVIEQAQKDGAAMFDMLRGKGHHKERFENDRRIVQTHVAVRHASLSYAKVQGVEAARRVYRRLPDEGAIGELKKRIRG